MSTLFHPARSLRFNAEAALLLVLLAMPTAVAVPFAGAQIQAETPAERFVLTKLKTNIDLGVAKRWRAKTPAVRNYAQLHRVAGWVLIPLIAAAITGFIK